jgi:diadenosine tetraphosphate (Ap4A) HIT family hydrolase
VDKTKNRLQDIYAPDGFNIGVNVGEAAGQTVPHMHIHVIPRYVGDMDDPRGGVRGVIPNKQKY